MDEFVQFQQVLDRHGIPYHARDPRPWYGPMLIIIHARVTITVFFDRHGTYTHQKVERQQEDAYTTTP